MTQAGDNSGIPPASAGMSRGGWIHFGVASGILVVAAAGFHVAKRLLRVHLVKSPVPWTKETKVEDYRLVNFPKALGPDVVGADGAKGPQYVVGADGELFGSPDGKTDGFLKLRDEQLSELGTKKHHLNWYFSGIYRDTRVPGTFKRNTGRYLQLDITYYTGLVDPVPHVPEICVLAAGGRPLADRSGSITVEVPGVRPAWRKIKVRRIAYALREPVRGVAQSAQYYVFSMNGSPTDSRHAVRGKLTLPWKKYCYFAKVQVVPHWPEPSLEDSDAVCREFLRYAMPAVLRFMPSAKDVEDLKRSDGPGRPQENN